MRSRQIYQCDSLITHLGDVDPALDIPLDKMVQIHRVQEGSFGYSVERQDINQFGQLGRIDTLVLSAPEVPADFTYYLNDFKNEKALGFHPSVALDESFTKNLLSRSADNTAESEAVTKGKNFYMLTCVQGEDANIGGIDLGETATVMTVAKAFVSDYNIEASIGSIPTASFSISGSNQKVSNVVVTDESGGSGVAQQLIVPNGYVTETGEVVTVANFDVTGADGTLLTPYLPDGSGYETMPTALRPGDIVLELGDSAVITELVDETSFVGSTGAHIQSFSMNIPLSRTKLERLGNNFAFAEEVEFPVEVTVNISAIVGDLKDGSVYDELINGTQHDLTVTFKDRTGADQMKFKVAGAEIVSENASQSIGGQKTVDITYSAQIAGPEDTASGVFAYGLYDTALFNYDV